MWKKSLINTVQRNFCYFSGSLKYHHVLWLQHYQNGKLPLVYYHPESMHFIYISLVSRCCCFSFFCSGVEFSIVLCLEAIVSQVL